VSVGYIPLHVHTIYSPYQSLISLDELVSRARFLGFPAVGISDHLSTYSHFTFYRLARENGIKPIFGVELTHSSLIGKRGTFHLTVIAENNEGYKNLVRLVSLHLSRGEGKFVTVEELSRNRKGLIALSGCKKGEVSSAVLEDRPGDARKVLERLIETFGENRVFVELMNHGLKEDFALNDQLSTIAGKLGIGVVVTNNDRFIERDDAAVLRELMRIAPERLSADLNDEGLGEFYLKREDDLRKYFYSHEEALSLSGEIAARCNVEFPSNFKVCFGGDAECDERLNQMCRRRFILRYHHSPAEKILERRMNIELKHFGSAGLSPFVLSILMLFNEARKRGISVEVSAGSILTSFVHYLLDMIPLNPVEHGLQFERHAAKPGGVPPSMELIVPVDCKDTFIGIVEDLFKGNCICFHIAQERMSLHTILSRLCDSYEIEESKRQVILSEVSSQSKVKVLSEVLAGSDHISRLYSSDLLVRKILHAAFSLRDKVLHLVMNSSKIVVMGEEFREWASIVEGRGAIGFANIDQDSVDDLDGWTFTLQHSHFLSAIEDTIKLIEGIRKTDGSDGVGRDKTIDFSSLDDKKTFSLIKSAETMGVYFLEGKGVRDLITRVKPGDFKELVNLIALYKPATLSEKLWKEYLEEEEEKKKPFVDRFVEEKILKETRGVLLFDTQVKDVLYHFAGIKGEDAERVMETLRGSLSADLPSVRLHFIKAALEKGADELSAQGVFDYIAESMRFVQNKASICMQAFLSYRTAYFKAHFFIQYFASLLNSYSGIRERQAVYLNYLDDKKVKVEKPDVNLSGERFLVEGDRLRAPLTIVKGLEREAVSAILEERQTGGSFSSFEDFMERVGWRMDQESIDSLIDSGAFNWLRESRENLKELSRELIQIVKKRGGKVESDEVERSGKGQLSLFDEENGV